MSFNSGIAACAGYWPWAVQVFEELLCATRPSAISWNSVMSAVGAGLKPPGPRWPITGS